MRLDFCDSWPIITNTPSKFTPSQLENTQADSQPQFIIKNSDVIDRFISRVSANKASNETKCFITVSDDPSKPGVNYTIVLKYLVTDNPDQTTAKEFPKLYEVRVDDKGIYSDYKLPEAELLAVEIERGIVESLLYTFPGSGQHLHDLTRKFAEQLCL